MSEGVYFWLGTGFAVVSWVIVARYFLVLKPGVIQAHVGAYFVSMLFQLLAGLMYFCDTESHFLGWLFMINMILQALNYFVDLKKTENEVAKKEGEK